MTLKFRREMLQSAALQSTILRVAGGLLVFVALAEWLLWLMPHPHRPLQYMIAGTASTVAALGLLFGRIVTGRINWSAARPIRRGTE